jgi:hypothetical protein
MQQWIVILDGPLLDSTSDYSKCNILFLQCLYLLRGETPILHNCTVTHVGIVPFEGETPSSNNKNTITMVEPFSTTAAWLWQISQYPCSSIFEGGLRAGCKGFIQLCKSVEKYFFLVN